MHGILRLKDDHVVVSGHWVISRERLTKPKKLAGRRGKTLQPKHPCVSCRRGSKPFHFVSGQANREPLAGPEFFLKEKYY